MLREPSNGRDQPTDLLLNFADQSQLLIQLSIYIVEVDHDLIQYFVAWKWLGTLRPFLPWLPDFPESSDHRSCLGCVVRLL
jgi:hypothetical protein